MTLEEWNSKSSTIPLWQLMKIIHHYTERLRIEVIIGDAWLDEKDGSRRLHDFTLTKDAFAEYGFENGMKTEETKRLLRYYADAPCWNVTADFDQVFRHQMSSKFHGSGCITPVIVARVHYRDIREGFLREKEDIRRERRREARRKNNGKTED